MVPAPVRGLLGLWGIGMVRNIPVVDMEKTGRRITELREDAGISVKSLQEFFDFTTPQAIYKWQKGITLPSIDNLVLLSMLFEIPMDKIIVTNEEVMQQARDWRHGRSRH